MKVLQIASGDFFSTYGGGQVYVKNIVDCMIGQGVNISVVSSVGKVDGINKRDYKGIDLYEIGDDCHLEEAIKLAAPDVIHAHSLKHLACRIGKKLDIPVVVTAHHGGILCPAGTLMNYEDKICHTSVNHNSCLPCVLKNTPTGLGLWYPFVRHLPERAYRCIGEKLKKAPFILFVTPIGSAANHIAGKQTQWNEISEKASIIIAPCNSIGESMILNGLNRERMQVLPHGIVLPASKPDFPSVVDGKLKFFYVGRICYGKGIHVLLKAFHYIRNIQPIELHLIGGAGNKREERYMRSLKKKYASDKRIIWHGKIAPEQVFKVTENFHVGVTASICMEIFGLNIAEALALGKPVLATECGGGEMQIRDGENGWLVPPNNVTSLACKISEIASNPSILPQMSRNCHAIDVADHCNELNNLYKKILTQNEKNTH